MAAAGCVLLPVAEASEGLSATTNTGLTYVGNARCSSCHIASSNQFVHTVHANAFKLNPKNESDKYGCEKCHGPGSEHIAAKDPGNPANRGAIISFTREWGTPVEKQNSMCMNCHQGGQRNLWAGSVHAMNRLSCSDCHNPMANLSGSGLLKNASISETCFSCHRQQRGEFAKRSHMPVPEGKMTCVDCHNPHGSATRPLLKGDSVNETCVSCHTEKRGPFIWEHAPVRENCLNCHNAHGSNNEKLLQVSRPLNCQRCHGNTQHPSTLYNASQSLGGGAAVNSRVLGRSCQNCHPQVHGSNHPAGARFQR
jgi:DmsE family decaheme c-type cytochrome